MYLNFEAAGPTLNEWNVLFFLLFYNDLDLNNQKILWLPSIYQFERTGTNLDHPIVKKGFNIFTKNYLYTKQKNV